MAYLAVSYQLNNAKDYQPLWDEMRRLGAHKAMQSFYLLDRPTDARSLCAHLRQFTDGDDMVFVSEMSDASAHQCYKGTNDWVSARF